MTHQHPLTELLSDPVQSVGTSRHLTFSSRRRRALLGGLIGSGQMAGALILLTFAPLPAVAGGLDGFTNADMTGALKDALEKGASAAVAQLGVAGGFLNNEKVRIPLPEGLRQGEKLLRLAGRGDELDALTDTMNRAAEMAVPQARQLLTSAVRSMSVQDAKSILTGGEDSVTEFFRGKTRTPLFDKFLPIVDQTVNKLGLAKQYNALADKAGKFGLVKGEAASVQKYVTGKALDGLYAVIAEQEKLIRQDPVKAGGRLIGKVFGAMR